MVILLQLLQIVKILLLLSMAGGNGWIGASDAESEGFGNG